MPEVASISLLNDLEARQDDVLRLLDALDLRITAVIAEYAPHKLPAAKSSSGVKLAGAPGELPLAATVQMPRLADGAEQPHADGQAQKAA